MAHLAPNYEERQEFWKPAVAPRHEQVQSTEASEQVCQECGTDFMVGSRFCYVCGGDRGTAEVASSRTGLGNKLGSMLDLGELTAATGLPVASLVAFFVGIICVIAAATVGFIYTATTMLDWQAVQIWRMEWLLAAIAAFAAGALLKR